jgi:hypothetical protein
VVAWIFHCSIVRENGDSSQATAILICPADTGNGCASRSRLNTQTRGLLLSDSDSLNVYLFQTALMCPALRIYEDRGIIGTGAASR